MLLLRILEEELKMKILLLSLFLIVCGIADDIQNNNAVSNKTAVNNNTTSINNEVKVNTASSSNQNNATINQPNSININSNAVSNKTAVNANEVLIEDDKVNTANTTTPSSQNNATSSKPTNNVAGANTQANTAESELSDDEKLKNNIITFDRADSLKNSANIKDPFIYISLPTSQEDLESIAKTEQAVLILNGIFGNRASINNKWYNKDDSVEGWKVLDIFNDRVELTFRDKKKVLYVYKTDNNIKFNRVGK